MLVQYMYMHITAYDIILNNYAPQCFANVQMMWSFKHVNCIIYNIAQLITLFALVYCALYIQHTERNSASAANRLLFVEMWYCGSLSPVHQTKG